MDHVRVEHHRKLITAICMIAAPAIFFASDAIWPVTSTEAKDVLADATGATGRAYAGTVLALVAFVLFAGAILGLAHLLHERRPGLALVGGALSLAGIVVNAAVIGMFGMVLAEAPDRDPATMTGLLDDLMTRAEPLFIVGLLLSVGVIVLAIGLQRTRVVAPWAAICLVVAAVALGIAAPLALKPIILAGEVVLFAGLGAIGLQLLNETDEEWKHTPEFQGYSHPLVAQG